VRGLIFIVLLSTFGLQAQKRFINSVHIDLYGNQIDGDGVGGYNYPGIQGGLGTLYRLERKIGTLGFEMNYAQKGARKWPRTKEDDLDEFLLEDESSFLDQLNYVEVPLFFIFESWGIPFEFGPTFSYLINFKSKKNGIVVPLNQDLREFEMGLMFGINYKISEKVYFKFRISNSITPIYKAEVPSFSNLLAGGWHRGAGLNLTYYFNNPSFKSEGLAPVLTE
tara:strand:- start:286 stop:954 length:669 start_codon:yes stop_codon:yes gene_type:complete